jgi:hypothetical protein
MLRAEHGRTTPTSTATSFGRNGYNGVITSLTRLCVRIAYGHAALVHTHPHIGLWRALIAAPKGPFR